MVKQVGTSEPLDTWGADGVIVVPDITKIDEGWLRGEQPPHEWMNYVHNSLGQKVNHALVRGVPDWVGTTAYTIGAVVNHDGAVWIARASSTNSPPGLANSNWANVLTGDPMSENTVFIVDWGTDDSYSTGDTVRHSNALWMAQASNSGSEPTNANGNWARVLIGDSQKAPPVLVFNWSASETYATASIVRHDGDLWLARASNAGSEPTTSNSNWTLISTQENFDFGAVDWNQIAVTAPELLQGSIGDEFVTPDAVDEAVAFAAITDAASVTIDLNVSRNWTWTIGGDRILTTPSNLRSGQSGEIVITQDSNGGRGITFGSAWKFPGGAPILSADPGSIDVISYRVVSASLIIASFQAGFQ